eukprot:jgi/Orpsp1_1/1175281/evm.model.c7180000053273.1
MLFFQSSTLRCTTAFLVVSTVTLSVSVPVTVVVTELHHKDSDSTRTERRLLQTRPKLKIKPSSFFLIVGKFNKRIFF